MTIAVIRRYTDEDAARVKIAEAAIEDERGQHVSHPPGGPETPIARWRERMQMTQRGAAQVLGMSLSAYQEQERGASFAGQPRAPSHTLLLACAALEFGIDPVE